MSIRNYRRPLVSAAAIFLTMNMNRMFNGGDDPVRAVLSWLIWASVTASLFIPRNWWTRTRASIAGVVIAAECAVGILYYREMNLLYLVAIVLFAFFVRRFSLNRDLSSIIAVLAITAALYIRFGRGDLFNLFSFALVALVFYFIIRSRVQRNELFEQNKRQLAELQVAYERLQEASVTDMHNAVLEERTRIARDIHDAVGHSLTSLIVQIQALRYMLKADPELAARKVDELLDVARQGLHDIRTSVHALADSRDVPGIAALESLLARAEASARLKCALRTELRDEDIGAEAGETLFRVLREALTNVVRHSHATTVEVELRQETSGVLKMRIRDNGALAGEDEIAEGFGLRTMRTRLEAKGGSLRWGAAAPNGFELVAAVPNEREED